jgi:putative ABC transport system ATP-binding protein
MDLLFRLCRDRGQTLILVTHNHNLAKACDRTLELKSGKFQTVK